jgi:hypothetical protein
MIALASDMRSGMVGQKGPESTVKQQIERSHEPCHSLHPWDFFPSPHYGFNINKFVSAVNEHRNQDLESCITTYIFPKLLYDFPVSYLGVADSNLVLET